MRMNPQTFDVSVPSFSYPDSYNSGDWPNTFGGSGTTKYTFTFQKPSSAPGPMTPANVR
jgi:hypothetical protein